MKMSAKGFTLVEAMVSSALVGLIAIGILTVIVSFAKNSARFTAREELDDLGRVIQLLVADDALCPQVLNGGAGTPLNYNPVTPGAPTPPTQDLTSIGNPPNTVLITSNTRLEKFPHLRFGQIRLLQDTGVTPLTETISLARKTDPTVFDEKVFTSYRVDLEIPAQLFNDAGDNTLSMAPLRIPIKIYTTAPNNAIERCMLASSTNQTCISLGGTFDSTTGHCVFPKCDRARQDADMAARNADADPSNNGLDYRCKGTDDGINPRVGCTPPVYFWGFQANGTVTQPLCLCMDSCSPPPPPY